ncbi:cation:proton antiporter [Halalkalibacter hemicellulosilyticus]|uniref:Sodium/hydrogen exchanger family protein n=1 Tax=Halalkalibacter hemicellulosilyticusJCM 9152 TaxID=1236971 RepID=W4QG54_9BACI|nr:cation:proton antiporter [Halalkalibacter hemicellulosilyticus]GAE31061.1 sodium/hydrogen exchanger family protein [Halalkalibacter hemicellulosilyticusJCM 9152]
MGFPELLSAGLLFLLLFIAGFVGLKLKVPNVVFYILAGVIVASFITDTHLLHFAGEVGIVLLFFMLGMEFPIKQLLNVAKKVMSAGVLDVVLCFGVTVAICLLMGLDMIPSLIIGGVAYATSSSITAKMLESSKRMANPESEFMLGLLIFEDLVAPILVAILVGLTAGTAITYSSMSLLLIKVLALIVGALILGRFLFSKLGPVFDRYMNHEIFLLFVIGLALAYGGLALYLDLSEVLGTTITFSEGIPMVPLLITLIVWSIIAKLIVGYFGGQWYGLSKKVALRAGLSLTQRGEFSIIIATLATGMIQAFSSIFILISAMIGILLFQFAPTISKKLMKQQNKRKVVLD